MGQSERGFEVSPLRLWFLLAGSFQIHLLKYNISWLANKVHISKWILTALEGHNKKISKPFC
jgi:hypothetical protein